MKQVLFHLGRGTVRLTAEPRVLFNMMNREVLRDSVCRIYYFHSSKSVKRVQRHLQTLVSGVLISFSWGIFTVPKTQNHEKFNVSFSNEWHEPKCRKRVEEDMARKRLNSWFPLAGECRRGNPPPVFSGTSFGHFLKFFLKSNCQAAWGAGTFGHRPGNRGSLIRLKEEKGWFRCPWGEKS